MRTYVERDRDIHTNTKAHTHVIHVECVIRSCGLLGTISTNLLCLLHMIWCSDPLGSQYMQLMGVWYPEALWTHSGSHILETFRCPRKASRSVCGFDFHTNRAVCLEFPSDHTDAPLLLSAGFALRGLKKSRLWATAYFVKTCKDTTRFWVLFNREVPLLSKPTGAEPGEAPWFWQVPEAGPNLNIDSKYGPRVWALPCFFFVWVDFKVWARILRWYASMPWECENSRTRVRTSGPWLWSWIEKLIVSPRSGR